MLEKKEIFEQIKWSLRKKIMAMYIAGGLLLFIAGIWMLIEVGRGQERGDAIVKIAREYAPENKVKIVNELYKVDMKGRKFIYISIILGLFSIPLAMVIALVVTNKLYYQPIDELVSTATKILEGQTQERAKVTRQDEFGLLASVFNKMTEALGNVIEYQKTQINKMLPVFDAMAKGDLTIPCDIRSEDEFGLLSHALNKSVKGFRTLVSHMEGASMKIANAANDILASTKQQASGVTEQASQISEIASSLQELSATARQIATSSHNVLLSAEKATDTAEKGGKAVDESISSMHKIHQTVSHAAKKITTLGESSNKIGRITNAISDIAEQTNLLALNAAIEAARAGDQGRGFAVVADEIRKLAEKTAAQLEDINSLITTMQTETNSTIMAMEEGTKSVAEGERLINVTGNSLKEIIEEVKRTSILSKEITISTDEQTRGSEQLSYAMTNLSQVVKENETIARRNASLSNELNSLALELKSTISGIKIK
ncbi:MAG: Methyl-accepting chemotaxis protein McpQ [candidate division WS2 bacterium]|nr:Methyl-accepting chemotaxis protein McpQ [Candidatus Lithacetigena glycinireducens]